MAAAAPSSDDSMKLPKEELGYQKPLRDVIQRLAVQQKHGEIFFSDEPVIYALLRCWDPDTMPPNFLHLRLRSLNYIHLCGFDQSALDIFYRIFLNKQLSDRRTTRPRFLTAERRARINKRRKERLEAAARQ